MAPKKNNHVNHKQPLKVVIKRKKGVIRGRRIMAKNNISTQHRPQRGLPSFPAPSATAVAAATSLRNINAANEDEIDDSDDTLFANLACDTLLAIQSLQQSNKNANIMNEACLLEIPVDGGGGGGGGRNAAAAAAAAVYGVLECQLHQFFNNTSTGGSSCIVAQELDQLLQNNTLCRLSSGYNNSSSNAAATTAAAATAVTVYLFTTDYQRAARQAVLSNNNNNNNINSNISVLEWFLNHLDQWTGKRISQAELHATWLRDPPPTTTGQGNNKNNTAETAIRWLQDQQLLHVASSDHTHFQLWLPVWGRHVLPAMVKAQTDALVFLKQSRHRERSVVAVVQRLRRSPIPAVPLLLPWLVEQGLVQRVERPAGTFLQLLET